MIALGPVTSTAGTTYTAAQVQAMLQGPSLAMRWLYDLLSAQFNSKLDLTPLILTPKSTPSASAPAISHDAGRAVKRQLSFKMRASSAVNVLQDIVRVRFEVLAPDGGWLDWIIGTFGFKPPVKEIHESATYWSVTAPDLSELLSDASLDVSGCTPVGTSIAAAVRTLVGSYGGLTPLTTNIPDLSFRQPGYLLATALPFKLGDSYLKTITNLTDAMVFTTPWMDGNVLVSNPMPDFSKVTPVLVLDTIAGQAQVIGPFTDTPDFSTAYNVFIVTSQPPDGGYAMARYENHRADSPVSIENWGRRRMAPLINDSSLPDNEACYRRAQWEAQLGARIYSNMQVSTVPFPFFGNLDVITLAYQSADEGAVRQNFVVISGTHTCWPDAPTTGVLQRVVAA